MGVSPFLSALREYSAVSLHLALFLTFVGQNGAGCRAGHPHTAGPGVVLLIDDRFAAPDTRRLMPPHWEHLKTVDSAQALTAELERFWGREASPEGEAVSGPAR